MIEVTLRFDAQFRRVTNSDERLLELPEDCSLLEALRHSAEDYAEAFSKRLFTSAQAVQPTILVFVNENMVNCQEADQYRLKPGDEVSLYTPIAGG